MNCELLLKAMTDAPIAFFMMCIVLIAGGAYIVCLFAIAARIRFDSNEQKLDLIGRVMLTINGNSVTHPGITAEVVADSLNPFGDRLTSFVLRFPRIVLSEFNTHRVFSRNSASSRAIPFKKMVELAKHDPFVPMAFQKDHRGMQGTEYLESTEHDGCVRLWLDSRDDAIFRAESLSEFGVTKQLCNRLLEPFMFHTVLLTATEYENWFALRDHPAAEIHIADLAAKMRVAMDQSVPVTLGVGEWHIPFKDMLPEIDAIKIATARCARISYLNFDGTEDYQKDIQLHDDLADMGHMSPFEHCAQARGDSEWSGNFRGFDQYRKTVER